jgi:hypothetical protein
MDFTEVQLKESDQGVLFKRRPVQVACPSLFANADDTSLRHMHPRTSGGIL